MARASFTITDHSNENSNFGYAAAELTAGNIVAQTALHDALATAVDQFIIGNLSKHQVNQILLDDPAIPPNAYAQRESKALVSYVGDTSGKNYTMEIATPALTGNIIEGSDLFDLTATDVAALVTAFEAVAKAPDDLAETVTVVSIRFVGRNI